MIKTINEQKLSENLKDSLIEGGEEDEDFQIKIKRDKVKDQIQSAYKSKKQGE